MAKYLLLKHYRGAPAPANDVPMDRWTPAEVEALIRALQALTYRLAADPPGCLVTVAWRAGLCMRRAAASRCQCPRR